MNLNWKRLTGIVAVAGALAGAAALLLPGQTVAAAFSNGPGTGMMNGRMAQMHAGMMGGQMRGMRGGQMLGMHEAMSGIHDQVHGAVAAALGLTADELTAARQGGQSLADIAAEQGVTLETVQQVMLEAKAAELDRLVAEGALTQEQANLMLEHIASMDFTTMGQGRGGVMRGGGGHCKAAR